MREKPASRGHPGTHTETEMHCWKTSPAAAIQNRKATESADQRAPRFPNPDVIVQMIEFIHFLIGMPSPAIATTRRSG